MYSAGVNSWSRNTSTRCSASAAATAARSFADNVSRRSRPQISAPIEGWSGLGVGMVITAGSPSASARARAA